MLKLPNLLVLDFVFDFSKNVGPVNVFFSWELIDNVDSRLLSGSFVKVVIDSWSRSPLSRILHHLLSIGHQVKHVIIGNIQRVVLMPLKVVVGSQVLRIQGLVVKANSAIVGLELPLSCTYLLRHVRILKTVVSIETIIVPVDVPIQQSHRKPVHIIQQIIIRLHVFGMGGSPFPQTIGIILFVNLDRGFSCHDLSLVHWALVFAK